MEAALNTPPMPPAEPPLLVLSATPNAQDGIWGGDLAVVRKGTENCAVPSHTPPPKTQTSNTHGSELQKLISRR
jgi:hypothetical protein